MSLEMVAESFLSAFFDYLFKKMESPEIINFFRGRELGEGLLMKLKITMNTVSGLLDQAEEKQVSIPAVKRWIDDLKHAAYQADDLLDEIAYEDHLSKLGAGSSKQKVRQLISSPNPFVKAVNDKLQEIHELIEHLLKQMQSLGFTLRKGIGEKLASRPTTSLPEGSYDCDIRHSEKEAIFKSLQFDGEVTGVICIEGQAGIGKTTIARQVYNDSRVEDMFDHKAWVYVSQEFNASKITKDIVSQVCPSLDSYSDLKLQENLQKELKKKKFLLVLDDVWSVKDDEWEYLLKPLMFEGKGMSRIIITSRNQNVASTKKGIQKCICLGKLDDEDCWKLLEKYAFADGISSVDPAGFQTAGREIARKCGGLPLAAKVIGSLLRFKTSVREWKSISESNLWDLVGDSILPVLKLSYYFLPSHLKQCVAYCGIFPKGFVFRKEFLIYLWIGEGFLLQSQRKASVEDLGSQCFDSLVSMSFFEQANVKEPGNEAGFIMHDLVHDLSKSVFGDFGFRLGDDDDSDGVPMKTRHLFVQWEHVRDVPNRINEGQFLRSFLLTDSGIHHSVHDDKKMLDLLRKLKLLRVLLLEKQRGIYKMPRFIGNLNHLRYLSLRGASVRRLPKSICRLYYLQILILCDCKNLIELPENTRRLINLFCLDIRGTSLRDMPPQMGQLPKLRTLTAFFIGKHGRSRIKELRKLQNLRGELSIEIRQDYVSGRDATRDGDLCPELINKLELKWDRESRNLDQEQKQLQGLCPHPKLENLSIIGYRGTMFPDWLTKLSNLVCLKLSRCKNCSQLPPLGQLASLKDLSIIGLDSVESIGSEFYGTSQLDQPFQSLQILRFDQMQNWQKWENKAGAFSKLEKLYVEGCYKLSEALPSELPCLSKLDILQCEELVFTLPRVADNCDMELYDRSRRMKLVKRSASWQYLSIRNSESFLREMLKQIYGFSTASMDIEFGNCDSLNCLPIDLFPNVKTLRIRGCRNLQSFSATSGRDLIFPCQDIHIVDCPKLSLSPLLRVPAIETIMLDDSCFMLRFVRLPSGSFCLQISLLLNAEALKMKLRDEHASTIQEIEIRKDVKHQNLLQLFPDVKSFKVVNSCKSSEYPLSVMEMANPGDFTYLNSWEIASHNDIAIFPKDGQPAKNLTSLTISKCCKLKSLPDWMNHLFPCLANLEIVNCPELESFPRGSLPSRLQKLHVKKCDKLSSLTIFTVNSALVTLKLENLETLQFLHHEVLKNLANLEISDCPQLQSMPQGISDLLPSLKHMTVCVCPRLKSFLKGGFSPTVHSLDIQYCNRITSEILNCDFRKLPNFYRLALAGCQNVELLPEEMLFPCTLTSLGLLDLKKLTSLQLKGLLHLTQLQIGDCPKLQRIPGLQDLLPSLSNLTIHDCPLMESFLEGGLPSRLQGLYVWHCEKLVAGLMQFNLRSLPSLSLLKIGGFDHVEYLPEETLLPSTLTFLEVWELRNLRSLKLQHLTSLQHLIIRDCPLLDGLPEKLLDRHYSSIHGCPLLRTRKRMTSQSPRLQGTVADGNR